MKTSAGIIFLAIGIILVMVLDTEFGFSIGPNTEASLFKCSAFFIMISIVFAALERNSGRH